MRCPVLAGSTTEALAVRIPLGRDEALVVKKQVRGLIACRLIPPFVSERRISGQATITSPTESHYMEYYVHISPLKVWFFDSGSGRILARAFSR